MPTNTCNTETCFSPAYELSPEDIAALGLDDTSFQDEVIQDVNGDGLVDTFSFYACKESSLQSDYSDSIYGYQIRANITNSTWRGYHSLLKECKDDENLLFDQTLLTGGRLALADVNVDGLKDIVVQYNWFDEQTSYQVYYNQNPITLLPKKPYSEEEWFYPNYIYNGNPKDNSTWKEILADVSFHPHGARFVQINQGRLIPITGDENIILDHPSSYAAFNLDNIIIVTFYDQEKQSIKAVKVPYEKSFLDPVEIPCQKNGVTYYSDINSINSLNPIHSQKIAENLDPELQPQLSKLITLWGKENVSKALEFVFFIDAKNHGGQVNLLTGVMTINMTLMQKIGFHQKDLADTIMHETAHNLDSIFSGNGTDNSVLTAEWEEFNNYQQNPVFSFINESFFFDMDDKSIGHSQDGPSELFASTTMALNAGPEAFKAALKRWDKEHDEITNQSLRADLKVLLQGYEQAVRTYNPSSTFNFKNFMKIILS